MHYQSVILKHCFKNKAGVLIEIRYVTSNSFIPIIKEEIMQRILMIFCFSLFTGLLSGCGIFCPPRHEVLVIEQPAQAQQSGQTEQTNNGTSEEIPLISTPDPETVANTLTSTPVVRTSAPRTYIMLGYPAFYAGWYPYWGWHRPLFSFGYHHRRHHFHHRPPPRR